MSSTSPSRVVILGGGFAGMTCAQALNAEPVHITLIDRRNHHLFQPLLYQVATASLSPADIAAPIRKVFSHQRNCTVLLGDVVGIDITRRTVTLQDGVVPYDTLVVATGVTHSYFGNDQWAPFAPGLKTVEDAIEIRRRFLLAFEAAERETDPAARRAKLTFIIVGGGPTGVELAGTMAEIAHRSLPRDFRHIDTSAARIILVEAQPRVLAAFDEENSADALRQLHELRVEVRLGARVTAIDEHGVNIGPERIDAECVIWAAGVTASPLGKMLGAPCDRAGRVEVAPDLSLVHIGHPEVFVAGDLAKVIDPRSRKEVPGMAPGAMQMGRHVGKIIREEARAHALDHYAWMHGHDSAEYSKPAHTRRPAFNYTDKGTLATIGRARAVAKVAGIHFGGVLAWLLWAGIHISYLIGFRNRLIVMLQWAWQYFFFERGARLITGEADLELKQTPSRSVGM